MPSQLQTVPELRHQWPIVHPADYKGLYESGAQARRHWHGKTEELGEKAGLMPLYTPQIPHGLTRWRTRASVLRRRRLTA
jgi:hypothetical protein